MVRIRSTFLAAFVFTWFLALISSVAAADVPADTIKILDDLSTEMMDQTLKGNLMVIPNYYTEDIILMPDFKPPIRGRSAMKRVYKDDMNRGIKYHSFNGNVEKRWQHGNDIYEYGSFGLSISEKKSPKPSAFYGSYFQIWQKQKDGTYLISYAIWNLDFNPFP